MDEIESKHVYKPLFFPSILDFKATFEALQKVESKIDKLEYRLIMLEDKLEEKTQKLLTEERFIKEIESSEEIVEKIVERLKQINHPEAFNRIDEKLFGRGELEKARIVTDLLKDYGKLSSLQLAQLMNISRTRANEYLKMLENSGVVKGILIGKEKLYYLKD